MVVIEITMSLDGFIAGPNISPEQPMGEGGPRLHDWLFAGKTETDAKVAEAMRGTYGAVILGGRTYHDAIDGDWGGVNPFETPAFVLSKKVDVREGFTFVTDGIESALTKAKTLAGDRNVWVMGGANTIQQYIKAGLFDELRIHIAPVLFGEGTRLFDNIGTNPIELEPTHVIGSPRATHLQYRVVR